MTQNDLHRSAFFRRDVKRRFALVLAVMIVLITLITVSTSHARADVSLRGVHPVLAAKARQIVRACGSHVVSGVRRTRVAGSRRMSLHASGRAVELRGNPRCIYARLKGWPGGVSTDYGRVRHVHLSWGGNEHGRRFVHRFAPRRVRLAMHRG